MMKRLLFYRLLKAIVVTYRFREIVAHNFGSLLYQCLLDVEPDNLGDFSNWINVEGQNRKQQMTAYFQVVTLER
jgi:hypothetical protein